MRRTIYLLIIIFFWITASNAQRNSAGGSITTGDIVYTYLGPGADPNTAKYEIAMYTSADCSSIRFPDSNPTGVFFAIYSTDDPTYIYVSDNIRPDTTVTLRYTPMDNCLSYPEPKCMETVRAKIIIDLPIIPGDYIVTTNWIGRRATLVMNIDFQYLSGNAIFVTTIPGTAKMGLNKFNSSPRFTYPTEQTVCAFTSFSRDFSSTDPDGDVLTYQFSEINTYDGSQPYPLSPPYSHVVLAYPYSPDNPLGTTVWIEEKTGIVTGVAPPYGYYRVGILVSEYRNGILVSQHVKESLIYANYCEKARAWLKKEYSQCKSLTLKFKNEYVSTLPVSYHWDFGVKNSTTDTSNVAEPTFTYPDTGTYTLKLIVFNGSCMDSATSVVKVYPPFNPGFIAKVSCANLPVAFVDTSKTKYGYVNSWSWDFGDLNSITDTSSQPNYSYQYPVPSFYDVKEIVTTSLGCRDTVSLHLPVYKQMVIRTSKDTTICGLDSISLNVLGGNGTITWSPNYSIDDIHSPTPKVSPDTSTLYKVNVYAGPGCSADDSVYIKAITSVGVNAYSFKQICEKDTVHLWAKSDVDGKYTWTPATNILYGATSDSMVARPPTDVLYTVFANYGSCVGQDTVSVKVYAYPVVQAFGDTIICQGKKINIGVTGSADTYTWSPGLYLSDIHSATQLIAPDSSITYNITAQNSSGCIVPVVKSIVIMVTHVVNAFAGNDTAVIKNQVLQLQGSGGMSYEWSPSTGLNNPFIQTPIAVLDYDQIYRLKVTNANGCIGYDNIKVRVFNTGYDIFVPTAFTPNHDGLNDKFTPLPVGIVSDYLLMVFNRWGELIFQSNQPNFGWDGTLKGNLAPPGVYVWYVKAKTLSGTMIEKKGTVALIR